MKIKKRPWIALFSHTGKEIEDICVALDTYPTIICTNNPGGSGKRNMCTTLYLDTNSWDSAKYRSIFETCNNPVITLHGWMKIIPSDICNEYEIYNGHPALINEYPQLKGKDMQLAVINELDKYPYIGSVIHKCTPEVDCGEILDVEKIHNFRVYDKRLIFDVLRNTSLLTWLRFLPEKLL